MFEFAKKGFYVGLGLASFTKEKAESFAREFAKRAELSEDEGRRFADYLREESGKAHAALRETVEGMVHKTMERMPFQSRLDAIDRRIAALEKLASTCCPQEAEAAGVQPTTDPADSATAVPDEDPAPQ